MPTVMDELKKTEDLLAIVEQETGKKGVELDNRLDSLGLDSLEFVCLMQMVEEQFKVNIPPEHYTNINTVRDIRVRM